MAMPRTRKEFSEYCLRRLGAPVLKINVSPDQIEDRIDEALQWFQTFCHAGTERSYYSHPITVEEIKRGYIDVPDELLYVVSCFPIDGGKINGFSTSSMMGYGWNMLYTFPGASSAVGIDSGYRAQLLGYSAQLHLFDSAFVNPVIRFTQNSNRVFIDANWGQDLVSANPSGFVNQFVMLDCYRIMDPKEFPKVWNDEYLKRYATALIRQQWGNNIGSKFVGGLMPGGVQFNSQALIDQSVEEIKALKQEIIDGQENLPAVWFIG